jgi:hypothetical protein
VAMLAGIEGKVSSGFEMRCSIRRMARQCRDFGVELAAIWEERSPSFLFHKSEEYKISLIAIEQ